MLLKRIRKANTSSNFSAGQLFNTFVASLFAAGNLKLILAHRPMNLENVSGEFIIKFSSAILKFEVAISSSAKIQPAYTLSSDNPSPQTESSVGKREVLMYLNHLYFRTQYCG